MNEMKNTLKKMQEILEDATCADLAPYPVAAIGKLVTCTQKKKSDKKETEKDERK